MPALPDDRPRSLILGRLWKWQRIEQLEKFEHAMSVDELQALGKLVRDLTGYIKLTAGDKPDAIRDDLLLQARQLLGLTGI